MNMKKTIAAIAAGAVAVSAMATSVSALEDKTFTYNLAEYYAKKTPGKVTFTSIYNEVDLSGVTTLRVGITGANATNYTIKGVTVTGRYTSDNKAIIPIKRVTDDSADNYSATLKNNGFLDIGVGVGKEIAETTGVTFTVAVEVEHNKDKLSEVNGQLPDVYYSVDGGTTNVTNVTTASGFAKQDEEIYRLPFKTQSNGNVNIIQYLQGNQGLHGGKMKDKDSNYVNVSAVINDAIANYESVTFTFNTAADGIRYTTLGQNHADWGNDKLFDVTYGRAGDGWDSQPYEEALARMGGDASKVVAFYSDSWAADTTYKKFTDHLYNGDPYTLQLHGNYGAEGTGYVGFDWGGYNLFQGALVINENLTMSLSETDYFDYTNTSISFDWDAIMDGAATSNGFATYVQSIKLATSTTWYWDSMDIILTAGAAEDATTGAGTTGDEDSLDDGDEDDVIDDIDDDDDTVVDDGDDDDQPADTDEQPVVNNVVNNPQTGNASVALAVIPVALAAAAVVAKKRG